MTEKLSFYPCWLRKYIVDVNFLTLSERETALKEVFKESRKTAIGITLFTYVLVCIKLKFRVSKLEEDLLITQTLLSELEKEIRRIDRKS